MNPAADYILHAVLIGAGATLVMDLGGMLQTRIFRRPGLDYCLLGRWVGHLARGRMRHESIAAARPVAGECMLGWSAHYAIGMIFAGLLLAMWGMSWASTPTLGPALIVGLVTVAAPFFILQPALGAGIAAARTPRPSLARIRSLITHLGFGFGLYLAAKALAMVKGL